jgi:NADH-quinone oxidoreductase subunit L
MADVLYLIPLLPLLGAIVCGVFHALGGGWKDRAGYVASAAVAGSFVVALLAFFAIPSGHGEGHEGAASLVYVGWTWLDIGVLQVPFKLVIDPLSGFMALVVTGVGLLIHIYSIGYIAHDECRAKFFAFLNLFIVSMSILILGASMPLLFVGWEGVGVMSYLLIGFWYDKENGWPGQGGPKGLHHQPHRRPRLPAGHVLPAPALRHARLRRDAAGRGDGSRPGDLGLHPALLWRDG